MFIKESYPTRSINKNLVYIFKSQSEKRIINKVVVFQLEKKNTYNLAFGDEGKKGRIDVHVVSNNNDLVKVISTVAFIVHDFFGHYPNAKISIKGVDERRLKLYNVIFKRYHGDVIQKFEVNGFRDGKEEKYNPNESYDKFEIMINKLIFDKNNPTMVEDKSVEYGQSLEVTDEDLNRILTYVLKNQPLFPEKYYSSQKSMLITDTGKLFEKSPNLPLKQMVLKIMETLPDFLPAENLVEVVKIITSTWEELQKKVAA